MYKYLIPALITCVCFLVIGVSGGFTSAPGATPRVPALLIDPSDSTTSDGTVRVASSCGKLDCSYLLQIACCDTHKVYISKMNVVLIDSSLVLGELVVEPLSVNPVVMKQQMAMQLSVQRRVFAAIRNQVKTAAKK